MIEKIVRLGIVGCGAATEQRHLPASRATREVTVVALADKDLSRARMLGRRFGISRCVEDYHEFLDEVDGVIVAVPNHLHGPIAGELLERRIPVLVEKPLAPTLAEATQLVAASRRLGVPLQVGHMYRYNKATHLVSRLLDERRLGRLLGFSLVFATTYGWPVASGFAWTRAQAGGGVLIDLAPHTLDLLLLWLGDVVDVEYRDDNLGGVEAECHLSLALTGRGEVVRGEVILSRLRALGTTARIVGEHFTLEYGFTSWLGVRLWPSAWDGEASFASAADTFPRIYAEQLRAFAQAITDRTEPFVCGESVLKTIALVDRCYRERRPLGHPWEKPFDAEILKAAQ
ncbi:MAG: Gfo/Idh/MocA family oxidoreductase [Armatimonadota bacterium]|nr:Gfo/Idh/MocA family oxidoreductase [Armatimonadota bacterium]